MDKLPELPKDELGPMRRVLLLTQMINYMAYGLQAVNRDFEIIVSKDPESPLRHAKEEQEKILRLTIGQLDEVANRLANFLDGCDALDEDDLSVINPVFELLKPATNE